MTLDYLIDAFCETFGFKNVESLDLTVDAYGGQSVTVEYDVDDFGEGTTRHFFFDYAEDRDCGVAPFTGLKLMAMDEFSDPQEVPKGAGQ